MIKTHFPQHFPKRRLDALAQLTIGPHLPSVANGVIPYLQARHLSDRGEYLGSQDSFVAPNDLDTSLLLKPGELVLVAKGTRTPAWAYESQLGPLVPSSIFFVIRPLPNVVNPAFLAIFLNLPATQARLQALAVGSNIPSLRKSELAQLHVPLPDMDTQCLLVAMQQTHLQEIRLLEAITSRKTQLFHDLVKQLIPA
ncbi:MAG: restriction endonuclease subunit S [Bacteroidia bacterium]|nr:restriction endonuclease subunit S [Bacteroidia bacterium]